MLLGEASVVAIGVVGTIGSKGNTKDDEKAMVIVGITNGILVGLVVDWAFVIFWIRENQGK